MIVAVPGATAVTFPVASTFAISSLSDFHVTALFVAFSGDIFAVRVASSPILIDFDASNSTPVTATTSSPFSRTVISQTASTSPALAVIFDVPILSVVTFPFSTVATVLSLESHVTVLSVAFSGVTVAVSSTVSPTVGVAEVLSSSTFSTLIMPSLAMLNSVHLILIVSSPSVPLIANLTSETFPLFVLVISNVFVMLNSVLISNTSLPSSSADFIAKELQ